MKSKSKRLLSVLLTLAMVFGLFAVMPMTTSAADIGPVVVNITAPVVGANSAAATTTGTGYTVTLTAWSTPPKTENQNTGAGTPFTDVKADDWFFEAVVYVHEKGLMVGTADDKFSPNVELSRAMIVTILYHMMGEPAVDDRAIPFEDVQAGQWYTNAVIWAAKNEIVLGYGNGKFGTNDPVTKEQLAALIYRTQQADEKKPSDILMDFEWADWGSISDYAKSPVNVLTIQGIFRDIPGAAFNPQNPASRAEVASMLYRYLTAIEK